MRLRVNAPHWSLFLSVQIRKPRRDDKRAGASRRVPIKSRHPIEPSASEGAVWLRSGWLRRSASDTLSEMICRYPKHGIGRGRAVQTPHRHNVNLSQTDSAASLSEPDCAAFA